MKFLVTMLIATTALFAEKVYPTFDELNQDVAKICEELKEEQFDVLMGICSGGVIPVGLFAQYLENKNIQLISTTSYQGEERKELKIFNYPAKEAIEGKRVLLVDDIIDTGTTIRAVQKLLLEEYKAASVTLATLYVKANHCLEYPDYYAKEATEWVVFPWEISYAKK